MPMETLEAEESVQVPAHETPVPENHIVPPAPEPKPGVVVCDPNVNYDPYRGVGGDYIVNDEGFRVPLKK